MTGSCGLRIWSFNNPTPTAPNVIGSGVQYASILSGYCNTISCTFAGGCGSALYGSRGSTISGYCNTIAAANSSHISGSKNLICGRAPFSTIAGGYIHRIIGGRGNFIGGGGGNQIDNSSSGYYNSIVGGVNNLIESAGYSSILGGISNTISNYNCSFIVGQSLTITANNQTKVNTLSKASGSFEITHPDPSKSATKNLIHSFVESPTAGDNIYRYKVTTCNCSACIKLPDYYKFLNENDQVWTSPVCHFGNSYGIVDTCQEYVNISSNCDGDYNILVIGTRKDIDAKCAWRGVETWK